MFLRCYMSVFMAASTVSIADTLKVKYQEKLVAIILKKYWLPGQCLCYIHAYDALYPPYQP